MTLGGFLTDLLAGLLLVGLIWLLCRWLGEMAG